MRIVGATGDTGQMEGGKAGTRGVILDKEMEL